MAKAIFRKASEWQVDLATERTVPSICETDTFNWKVVDITDSEFESLKDETKNAVWNPNTNSIDWSDSSPRANVLSKLEMKNYLGCEADSYRHSKSN